MKAKNVQDYEAAWRNYIEQLPSLALAANIEWRDYVHTKTQLEDWLKRAILNLNSLEK